MTLAPIAGFIGTDIQIQVTETSTLARFRVGSTDRYRNAQGNWVEQETFWVTCQAWGKLADRIQHEAQKGDGVLLLGRWEQSTYERDGQKKTARFVTVEHFGLDMAIPSRAERQGAVLSEVSQTQPTEQAATMESNCEVENPL